MAVMPRVVIVELAPLQWRTPSSTRVILARTVRTPNSMRSHPRLSCAWSGKPQLPPPVLNLNDCAVVGCLIGQAAQRDVIHNDDTNMRVASLCKEPAPLTNPSGAKRARTGIFTTGILTGGDQPPIALFFTGHQHAGENLQDVLRHRDPQLPPPIQMCDALSRNVPSEMDTLLANCLSHGRRQVVDVATTFPSEARHILEALRQVYHHDALAKERQLTADQRLLFHQE